MTNPDRATYADAGVSLEKADTFLGALLPWVQRTESLVGSGIRSVVPNGYYASVLDLGLGRAIAMTTDGVGTKILVAEMAGDYRGIGIDCIAMNVNDLLCVGAEPVAMLDYLAMEDPPASVGDQIGQSLYEGSRQASICIPGGELAQLPEMIRGARPDSGIDLAGTAIGTVGLDEISTGAEVAAGDVLLGIASNGVHSNGFTLVRDVLLKRAGLPLDREIPEFGHSLGEELLRPTRIYAPEFAALRAAGQFPKAALHITGGGMLNLLRVTAEGVRFVIESMPPRLPVFEMVQRLGNVSEAELHRVFNLGVGMVLAVAPDAVDPTRKILAEVGTEAFPLGRVESSEHKEVAIANAGLVGRDSTFTQA